MLVMLTGVPIALAVAALYQAREAWMFGERRALRRFLGLAAPLAFGLDAARRVFGSVAMHRQRAAIRAGLFPAMRGRT
jgi:hypothetical protein